MGGGGGWGAGYWLMAIVTDKDSWNVVSAKHWNEASYTSSIEAQKYGRLKNNARAEWIRTVGVSEQGTRCIFVVQILVSITSKALHHIFFADTQTWIIMSRCPYKTVNSIKHKCVCHGMIGEECFGFGHCVDHAICQSRDDDLGIACQDGHCLY